MYHSDGRGGLHGQEEAPTRRHGGFRTRARSAGLTSSPESTAPRGQAAEWRSGGPEEADYVGARGVAEGLSTMWCRHVEMREQPAAALLLVGLLLRLPRCIDMPTPQARSAVHGCARTCLRASACVRIWRSGAPGCRAPTSPRNDGIGIRRSLHKLARFYSWPPCRQPAEAGARR